nr:DUF4239 domain-containing protein [uncultured Rhodopila sp.]
MTSFDTSLIVAGCSFGTGIAGMLLHTRLPSHHVDEASKDVIKLIMSLIATMAALVLSLLIASASNSYDGQQSEVQSLAANVILLDRVLAFYGPEAQPAREALQEAAADLHEQIWPSDSPRAANLDPRTTRLRSDAFVTRLQSLKPATDAQRMLQSQALQLGQGVGQTRLLMFEQHGSSISWPFLTVLVFWICMLFLGFGLFARFNATVLVALLVGAVSVAGAVFLILELSRPYEGFMRVSDAPLRDALTQIGR